MRLRRKARRAILTLFILTCILALLHGYFYPRVPSFEIVGIVLSWIALRSRFERLERNLVGDDGPGQLTENGPSV